MMEQKICGAIPDIDADRPDAAERACVEPRGHLLKDPHSWHSNPIAGRWNDPKGSQEAIEQALEAERAKLFEVFMAGWDAHGLGSLPEDAEEAFDTWLQRQVDEVDTVWLGEPTSEAFGPHVDQMESHRSEEDKMRECTNQRCLDYGTRVPDDHIHIPLGLR